ncbi:MAG: class I SAM-dependent methyltransferase [Alkalilacustris sp.]
MWARLLDHGLRALLVEGDLVVHLPDGSRREYGDGTGGRVEVRVADPGLLPRLVLNPALAVGEGYMEGGLTVAGDDLHGLTGLAIRNLSAGRGAPWHRAWGRLRAGIRRVAQFNPAGRARANVAHHYDLSGALYDLFLDADRQYSCAYFARPGMGLDEAQAAKKAHVAAKLCLAPGMRVLDIGCGWGGLAITLAREHGARVLGVTLSAEQQRVACARVREAGLSDRVEIRLMDYRDVAERFDRVVSVGMFEHVGVPHYRAFFGAVRDRLEPQGVALIHTIGRAARPGTTNPWIARYIFPGGYVPALSEMMAAVERTDLWPTDVEVWRLHYAETLRHWHDRFVANRARAEALYDSRFVRMWRFYLAASEMGFRVGRQCVFQLQLARDRAAVPLTRDYLHPGRPASVAQAAE